MVDTSKMFNGMFGKIQNGMCRLSMNGGIAVKTSGGYKSYNIKTDKLTNCSSFCFDIGEEFFFLIPTNKVEKGDIVLINGKPKCVIDSDKNRITAIDYEDSTVQTYLPERHVFMGNTYFYGKIVSMFGSGALGKGNTNKIMKYMMMSSMMKSVGGDGESGMSNLLPLMLMSKEENMFEGLFDFDEDSEFDMIENSEEKEEE